MSEVISTLCELIEIPSVNPTLASPSDPPNGERHLAEHIAELLKCIGASVIRQQVSDGRDNIIAILGSGNIDVMLCAHMDTVSGNGMRYQPFKPTLVGGKIYGRGACDTKASIAAMLVALRNAARSGRHVTIMFAATVDEECGASGAKALCKWLVEQFGRDMLPKICIVGEPTDLKIAVAHKGFVRGTIRTTGVSAHSSMPHLGVNAICRMAKVIPLLELYADEVLSKLNHPLLGTPTINIGMIRGGLAPNVVPERCEVVIDLRILPSQEPIEAWHNLREFIHSSLAIDFYTEFDQPELIDTGMETSPDEPAVKRLIEATRSALGSVEVIGVPYSTDASKFASIGIPSVVFGPGRIEQAHSADEFVEVEQVEKYAIALERFLLHLQ
ncbi:MAG: hypothetical protein GDYSWBUE_001612 [Candidatus Fervidibacterota bacterium]